MPSVRKQRVRFENLLDRPMAIEFTAPDQSSDGGVILLKAKDRQMGLTASLAAALRDQRDPTKVVHSIEAMLQERIYGIACGYPDANDAARLGRDPLVRMVCETAHERLASQPTLSRLENAPTRTRLLRTAYAFTDSVLDCEQAKRRGRRVRRITIDVDPTEDRTHGQQCFAFYNAFYGSSCYLPMVTTVQFGQEKEHYAVAPLLRPGNASGDANALAVLKRLLPRLRARFPKAKIRVRMDGAFATPEVFDWLETRRLRYAINMAKNDVLQRLAAPWLDRVRQRAQFSGQTEKTYVAVWYQAGTWDAPRRVIIKAEVTHLEGRRLRDNPRFVVTNAPDTPEDVYGFYALRGDVENRIKELKEGLRMDLTSCTRFLANQFRVLLTAAAYALYQQLRYDARDTECARAQVGTLRERLMKVAATVRKTVRRIVIEMPKAYFWLESWQVIAARVGACF